MSGGRLGGPRGGDQKEKLAHYLLMKLGLVSEVPRTEDIGFDFHCNLADQEEGYLTFGFPFLVQVKSHTRPVFALLPSKNYKPRPGEVPPHIAWLLRQELPLYLGVVDGKRASLRLYSLAPFWHVYYQCNDCVGLRFVPRNAKSPNRHIGMPVRNSRYKKWPVYDVDIGYPIVELSVKEAEDAKRLAKEKERLRFCIGYEMRNQVFFRAGIAHYYWFAETDRGKALIPAFAYRELPPDPMWQQLPFSFIGPALVPLARRYQLDANTKGLQALREIYALLPAWVIPRQVRDEIPEVFGPPS